MTIPAQLKTECQEKQLENAFGLPFCFVGFFGASVAAILFLAIECNIDSFANWTFLIHSNPIC